jgi:NADPH2:quinone reductase
MRRVICPQLGPLSALSVEHAPDLVAGDGQVVVDVRAAGVNYVDGLICHGRYQIKPPTPFTPGMEMAGVISDVGPGPTSWAVGDRVMAMTGAGSFASQIALNATSVVRVPDGIGFEVASTLIQSYATVLFALTRRTELHPDEWVVVLGAGGGVGLAAVGVSQALGAKVIAAASSADKLAAATEAGAEATINYQEEDLKARVREITGGGADVVIDPVGGDHSEAALRSLRFGGRYCVIGFASGPIPLFPLNHVLLNNRTIVGIDWGAWAIREPANNLKLISTVLDMVVSGQLHPVPPATYPLESAAQVMGDLLERRITGKAALVP